MATQEFRSYTRKFCSSRCFGNHESERIRATYPPKEEVERLYLKEGLTDRELGKHYGHSYQWALTVRRHHGIPGRKKSDPRKPLSAQRDRARWGMHLKPEDACRACRQPRALLNLHHAIPRSRSRIARYDLRNGLPLCTSCHLKWHHHKLVIYRDVFTAEEWAYLESVELAAVGTTAWLDDHYPPRLADEPSPPGLTLAYDADRLVKGAA